MDRSGELCLLLLLPLELLNLALRLHLIGFEAISEMRFFLLEDLGGDGKGLGSSLLSFSISCDGEEISIAIGDSTSSSESVCGDKCSEEFYCCWVSDASNESASSSV